MRNLKLVLSYDGTEFSGWQVQPGAATIQGALASAIGRVTGEKVLPQGSGRTDAGVHALGQVATFATQSPIPPENLVIALNDILPPSIRVLEAAEAPAEFHARKSARAKTYRYRMYRGAICPPFLARYVWHYPYPLDEEAMQAVAGLVVGEHDFTSFAAVDPERGREEVSNVRQIFVRAGIGRAMNLSTRCEARISAPHGAQPGRNIPAGRERNSERPRSDANSGSAFAVRRRSHCAGQRPVPGQRRVLEGMCGRGRRRPRVLVFPMATDQIAARKIVSTNPATGETLREFDSASAAEVHAAVAASPCGPANLGRVGSAQENRDPARVPVAAAP